ncbi:Zn-binding oxidoreductase [Blastocladiella britannica]|nr:Zn-binding oxidoreductase [Blastocladiella britannica]
MPVYGGPQTLVVATEHPVPTAGPKQLLVRVIAASCNAADWHIMRGDPSAARLAFGITKPTAGTILGNDFAGIVEAVGDKCTGGIAQGASVFGQLVPGAFADFVVVSEDSVAPIPAGWSFADAATLPTAGVTALQAVRDAALLPRKSNASVLINGASGGVGIFAVQIAKAMGAAHVTAVCSAKNAAMVQSLGADRVLDYATQDCTTEQTDRKYDVVLDMVGTHSFADYRKVMAPSGRFVPVGGPGGGFLGSTSDAIMAVMSSMFTSQKAAMFVAAINRKELEQLATWANEGKLKTVIQSRYPLEQVPEAIRVLEEGHVAGKLVIEVSAAPSS